MSKRKTGFRFFVLFFAVVSVACAANKPNILIAISDDQSWPHASAYGSKMVQTPNFDRIAKEGVLFNNAFSPSPGCSPSRAAFLTGRNTWQLEHAGTHASFFHPKYNTFPDRLAQEGYFVGSTGKGWGPGNFRQLGRKFNPAGRQFDAKPKDNQSKHAAAFARFLQERPAKSPFCFWFGSKDPHRSYKKGSGLQKGKRLSDAQVPPFLPDTPEIRSDMLDYAFEVERFDDDLGQILDLLEATGELDHTVVIVTSDNGIPVPRAKANCYEYGIHMPLAIRYGSQIHAGRTVDDLVGFTDLTATIYDLTNIEPPIDYPMVGKSIRNILESNKSGIVDSSRTAVYSARERHSSSRYNSLSYPQRCVRTHDFLYIRNFKPERWPAGPSQKYSQVTFDENHEVSQYVLEADHGGYHDIDACPTLTFLIQNRDDPKIAKYLSLAVGRRPAEELFDIKKDPGCLENLIGRPEVESVHSELRAHLLGYLAKTKDARVTGQGDIWETYPRVSGLRWFPVPEWASERPDEIPDQLWLNKRRPRR